MTHYVTEPPAPRTRRVQLCQGPRVRLIRQRQAIAGHKQRAAERAEMRRRPDGCRVYDMQRRQWVYLDDFVRQIQAQRRPRLDPNPWRHPSA